MESQVVEREIQKNRLIFLVFFVEKSPINQTDQELPKVIQILMQDYQHVFSEELPEGLLPIQGIEQQTDFIPSSVIPN